MELLKNLMAMTGQWHKTRFSVSGHGQTSLTVPPFVVSLNFFNRAKNGVFRRWNRRFEAPKGDWA